MRLRKLASLSSLRRYRKLRADFRTPLRALLAASGATRGRYRLMARSGEAMTVDRGDAPVWHEYFEAETCRVRIEDGLFRVVPHDATAGSYRIRGGDGCLTYRPKRWNPAAYRSTLVSRLEAAERRVYSQHGEDGVIAELLQHVPATYRYVVEFGAYDGVTMSNSRNLIAHGGWSALLIEGDPRFYRRLAALYRRSPQVTTLNTFITPENINALFAAAGVPKDFDVLSIDVDSIDYYLWQALTEFQPKIVVIEYNASIPPDREYVVPRAQALQLSGTSREGASIRSLYRLGREKGYRLVYSELSGANLFFVHEAYRASLDPIGLAPEELYQPPQFGVLAGGAAPNGRGYR